MWTVITGFRSKNPDRPVFEELDLLSKTQELGRDASRGVESMDKAKRAVAFHRKLADKRVFRFTSKMKEILEDCKEVLKKGALKGFA